VKCHQCSRPAMFLVGPEGQQVPLCLDCNVKLQALQNQRLENNERMMNFLAAQVEMTAGIPGLVPRFPARTRPIAVHTGDLVTNNLTIADSNIGVLNTGSIGSVDSAIGVLYSAGDQQVADSFRAFTEALVQIEEVQAEQKNHLLELLSVLSAEATVPAERRRKSAMRPLLTEIATLCSGVASLAALYALFFPAIEALFH
jgi:hypothetical protein